MFKKRVKKKEIQLEEEQGETIEKEAVIPKFNSRKRQKIKAGSTLENKNDHFD